MASQGVIAHTHKTLWNQVNQMTFCQMSSPVLSVSMPSFISILCSLKTEIIENDGTYCSLASVKSSELNKNCDPDLSMGVGHQKKLMLAVKRLAEMQRSSEGRGSLRKKPPPITQQQDVMSIDSPPPDGEVTVDSLQ